MKQSLISSSLRGHCQTPRKLRWLKAEAIHLLRLPQRWIATLNARNDGVVSYVPKYAVFVALIVSLGSPALAQTPPAKPNAEMMQQLQRMMQGKNSQQVLGQALAIGTLLGCTQKTAGKEATQAFYSEMQAIGKTVEGYCKRGHATQARTLLLATVEENADHAVTKAALSCYDAQLPNILALGGKRMAADAARYASWMRDPEAAKTDIKESSVCIEYPAGKNPANTKKPL